MTHTSRFAVAALIMGILPFIMQFFISVNAALTASVVAIVLGFFALKEIKHDRNLKGRGFAIVGIILGFIPVCLFVIGMIFGGK